MVQTQNQGLTSPSLKQTFSPTRGAWWHRLFDTQQKGQKGSAHKASCLQPRNPFEPHPPHRLEPTELPRTLHANGPCIHFLQKVAPEGRRDSSHIPLLPGQGPALPPPHVHPPIPSLHDDSFAAKHRLATWAKTNQLICKTSLKDQCFVSLASELSHRTDKRVLCNYCNPARVDNIFPYIP